MTEDTIPACDNTSVGVIARDSRGGILLVERRKFPTEILWPAKAWPQETFLSHGWAPPSGHRDGHSYGTAAFKKFEEETGLTVVGAPRPMLPKNPRKYFKCRRGGTYHDWQIFEVDWRGELKPSCDETKDAKWCSKEEIRILAMKTKWQLYWLKEVRAFPDEMRTRVIEMAEKEWNEEPGLEPVWYEFFQELKII